MVVIWRDGWPWLLAAAALLAIMVYVLRATPASEAPAQVAAGRLLVDVRSAAEWHAGRLQGSVHAPWTDAVTALERAGVPKDRPLLVYCVAGPRATYAAHRLRAAGYQDVEEVRGGIHQLAAAGLPVEDGPPVSP